MCDKMSLKLRQPKQNTCLLGENFLEAALSEVWLPLLPGLLSLQSQVSPNHHLVSLIQCYWGEQGFSPWLHQVQNCALRLSLFLNEVLGGGICPFDKTVCLPKGLWKRAALLLGGVKLDSWSSANIIKTMLRGWGTFLSKMRIFPVPWWAQAAFIPPS